MLIVFYGLSLIRCENPVGNSGVLGGPRCFRIAMDVAISRTLEKTSMAFYGYLLIFVDIC